MVITVFLEVCLPVKDSTIIATVLFPDPEVRQASEILPKYLQDLLQWHQPLVQVVRKQDQNQNLLLQNMLHCQLHKFNVNLNAEKWFRYVKSIR